MKIKFIPLLFVLGCLSLDAQIMSTDGASVYVSPNTLLFSTGDVKVTSASGVFTNEGNVEISQGTISSDVAKNFVLTYTNESSYGQLIVRSGNAATAATTTGTKEITIQKNLLQRLTNDAGAKTFQVNFGVPFVNYTYDQLTKDVTGNDTATSPGLPCAPPWQDGQKSWCRLNPGYWYEHPLFVWNYKDKFRWDPFSTAVSADLILDPGKRYILRKEIFERITPQALTNTANFRGVPYVAGQNADIPDAIPYQQRDPSILMIGNGAIESAYGIRFWTYLEDPFVVNNETGYTFTATTPDADLSEWKFGENILFATNPYTSNLDLKTLTNNFSGIQGVAVSKGVTNYSEKDSRETADFYLITVDESTGAIIGDQDPVTIIPPMSTFIIKKLESNNSTSLDLFSSSVANAQTFVYPSLPPSVTPKEFVKTRSFSSQGSDKYQLNLILSVGEKTSNTYLAAANDFETGKLNKLEASLPIDGGVFTTVYTIPEAEDGGVASGYENSKLYINTMSTNSSKTAIPVGVNVSGEDNGKDFTFTSDLRLNQIPLEGSQTNFASSDAKFYFHDKQDNVVKEIDKNFSYTVKLSESTNERFEIFWSDSGLISKEEDDNVINDNVVNDKPESPSNLTTIYKTGTDYKVRFNSSWNKADVTVFNVVGQLISSEKNVNTQTDYLIPLYKNASTMYIVVVTNPVTGEKITKKIVK